MPLPSNLVSQFVKVTKDDAPSKNESTVYATAVKSDGVTYVRLDGSDLLTPAIFTTNIEDGERVTVMIKNHTAIVTGNISSPSARTAEVEGVNGQVSKISADIGEVKILMANKVSTSELDAQKARIDELEAGYAIIGDFEADNVTVAGLLKAANAEISNLKAKDVEIDGKLNAADASIKKLDTEKLSADNADIKYANIDFTNIGQAAFEYFYSKSGLIENITIGNGTITGNLVGVTIKGDLIEGGTVVADKLVIKGTDGLYYKLNTNGVTTEYNSLDGSIITAKSITATKISVEDLVAFGATIGGFNITDTSLYSGIKETVNNTTRGIYLDDDGQFAIGDSDNYLRFYKDTDGSYKLDISVVKSVKDEVDRLGSAMSIDDGVHIYKPGDRDKSELVIDEDSVDIKANGKMRGRFSSSYIQLENYRIRRTSDRGIAFIPVLEVE